MSFYFLLFVCARSLLCRWSGHVSIPEAQLALCSFVQLNFSLFFAVLIMSPAIPSRVRSSLSSLLSRKVVWRVIVVARRTAFLFFLLPLFAISTCHHTSARETFSKIKAPTNPIFPQFYRQMKAKRLHFIRLPEILLFRSFAFPSHNIFFCYYEREAN